MSQKEINRYVVIQKSLEGAISVIDATAALNLSTRQVIRLRNGLKENGAEALVHKNQGRTLPMQLRRWRLPGLPDT